MAAKTFLAILLISFSVNAADVINNQDGSVTLNISPEEMLECEKKGGCVLISVKDVQDVAKNAALHMCGKSI